MRAHRPRIDRLIRGLLVLLPVVVGLLWFVYRPWALSWGATEQEIRRSMPGDQIVTAPTFNATRAVTVNAPPEAIWPWLLQMGYLRAGFYSYDRLDNDGVPSARRILPEFQSLAVGDTIPMNEHQISVVVSMDSNRSMVWVIQAENPWSWAWGLYPLNPEQTRLVTRLRVRFESVPRRVMVDLLEIFMMRKCMLGIKERAET